MQCEKIKCSWNIATTVFTRLLEYHQILTLVAGQICELKTIWLVHGVYCHSLTLSKAVYLGSLCQVVQKHAPTIKAHPVCTL